MYKRPPKHVERTRLTVLYTLMTLSVVAIVAIMIMVVLNYGYNRQTGTFEQRALVQFASVPSSATIEVDERTLMSRTSTKASVESGQRRFAVWREGYETWILNTNIEAGNLVWLNYIRLVPKDRPIETIRSYEAMAAAEAAPNNRWVVAQPDASLPQFRLINISNNTPTAEVIELPAATYEPQNEGEREAYELTPPTYEVQGWDDSSRYVMVWRVQGEDKQLIVLDTDSPERSVNVSRDFSVPIEQAKFSGRSGSLLYVVSDGNLRKLNISEGTVTRSLVDQVQSFSLHDDTTVTYVSRPNADGVRTAGAYRDGDRQPIVLRTVTDPDKTLRIAGAEFYGATYTAIVEDKTVNIFRGHYDGEAEGLQLISSRTFDQPVDKVEFNGSGSHVVLRMGNQLVTYGLEQAQFTSEEVKEGLAKDLFWIDNMHFGLVANGRLTMRDIDGSNVFDLGPARSSQGVTLSRNGTFLYSFGTNEADNPTFQRVRMILR